MFSERLENIIQAALQDGVLTEQEKAVIIKRAWAEGEDTDEVDIYIQSLMQKRQQELNKEFQKAELEATAAKKKETEARLNAEIQEEKERNMIMRKCPVCGTRIPALSNVCPECHHVVKADTQDAHLTELINVIKKGSPDLYIPSYDGEIENYGHTISKEEYDRLFNERPAYIRLKEGTWLGKPDYKIYHEYFIALEELEEMYGELPKVKLILEKEKIKRMNLAAEQCIEVLESAKTDEWWRDDFFKVLAKFKFDYGSLLEAQKYLSEWEAVSQEYFPDWEAEKKRKYEKKEAEKKSIKGFFARLFGK